jgi:ribosomal protein L29
MKDSDVLVLQEPKLSLGDSFYMPQVLIGLGTTMKHMLKVLGGKDRVIQYPEERREDIEKIEDGGMQLNTYRGVHRLNKDEDGRVKCVACFMCSTACPARSPRRRSSARPRSCRSRSKSSLAWASLWSRRKSNMAATDDLKVKTDDQLQQQLTELKREQFNLRFQAATNQLEKPSRVRVVRRTIARIKTLQSQRARTADAAQG